MKTRQNSMFKGSPLKALLVTAMAAFAASFAPKTSGALIAYENFDYPAGTDLSGQSGGAGWASNWTLAFGDTAVAGGFSYTDSLGNKLVTSGNRGHYSGASSLPGPNSTPFRDLPALRGANGTTTWITMIGVRVGPTSDLTSNPYSRGANLALFLGNTEVLAVGNSSGAVLNTWSLQSLNQFSTLVPTTAPFDVITFVAVRIDHKEGNDDAYLFINPTLGVEPDISQAAAQSLGAFDYSFDRVRPFAGNVQPQFGRPHAEIELDEIRVGETYADVTPYVPADIDGDGVPDVDDECPNSILTATVVIGGEDTGVPNTLFSNGCTISDLIAEIGAVASNHGKFVSGVAELTNLLKKEGLISGAQKGAIDTATARSRNP